MRTYPRAILRNRMLPIPPILHNTTIAHHLPTRALLNIGAHSHRHSRGRATAHMTMRGRHRIMIPLLPWRASRSPLHRHRIRVRLLSSGLGTVYGRLQRHTPMGTPRQRGLQRRQRRRMCGSGCIPGRGCGGRVAGGGDRGQVGGGSGGGGQGGRGVFGGRVGAEGR